MEVWIDMYHSIQRLARHDTMIFLTDNAVGLSEEENLAHLTANLAGDVAGIPLQSGFVGTATCAEEAALIPLASQSGMERLELRVFADGRYRAELSVRPSDPALIQRLTAAGFSDSGGLFVR